MASARDGGEQERLVDSRQDGEERGSTYPLVPGVNRGVMGGGRGLGGARGGGRGGAGAHLLRLLQGYTRADAQPKYPLDSMGELQKGPDARKQA